MRPISQVVAVAIVPLLGAACAHADLQERGQTAVLRSPGGRHLVEVEGGAVYVDGRRVRAAAGRAQVVVAPTWRADGDGLAWIERDAGETRLVVLAPLSRDPEPMSWTLPRELEQERIHWAGATRIVVGPALMAPRAVASWSEER
jgi:hypothetical protein